MSTSQYSAVYFFILEKQYINSSKNCSVYYVVLRMRCFARKGRFPTLCYDDTVLTPTLKSTKYRLEYCARSLLRRPFFCFLRSTPDGTHASPRTFRISFTDFLMQNIKQMFYSIQCLQIESNRLLRTFAVEHADTAANFSTCSTGNAQGLLDAPPWWSSG